VQGWVLKILSAERLERIFGCPCGWRGRPGQCAAFRPGDRAFSPATGASGARLKAWFLLAGASPGRYGGNRRRPVIGATGRGSSARRRASARRARRKLPHRQRCSPGSDLGRLRRVTVAALSLSIARAGLWLITSRPSGPARRRCALEAVEKVVTAPRATSICCSDAYVGMVYCRISVSPGMIDTMTRTGRFSAV